MIEKRYIESERVRNMCIKHHLYNICGTNAEYSRMLNYCRKQCVDLDDLYCIATDVKNHSRTSFTTMQIMEMLIDECCYHIIGKEKKDE